MQGVTLTPLKLIPGEKGAVMHGIKATDTTYAGFGEAYFSQVFSGVVKGWKKHNRMTLNLVVPVGAIRFVVCDFREGSATYGQFQDYVLGPEVEYARLTVEPGLWMAFQGVGQGLNLLMNFASIAHDPTEADALPLEHDQFQAYSWPTV